MGDQRDDIRLAVWLAAATLLVLLAAIEGARRRFGPDDAIARLWPRPDGSVPPRRLMAPRRAHSYGEVWDLGHEVTAGAG